MTEQPDREAIRARAQLRAVQMGYARPEALEDDDVQVPDPEPLPTTNPRVLRALLDGNHLTPDRAEAARAHLAHVAAEQRQSAPIHHFPEDAA